jgi:Ca-activated chloride channel homolog
MDKTSVDFRFAAAVAGYGMMLRESPSKGALQWPHVRAMAAAALGPDVDGYRAEFLKLVDKAASLRRTKPTP